MGNKTITYILSALFVITFGLGVFGYMNKDSVNNNTTPTPTPANNATAVNYNGDEKNVAALEDRISGYDFVKANKEFKSGYLSVRIDNNKVIVAVQKDGISGATEEMQDTIEYTIVDIVNPAGVQAQISQDGMNQVKVYILDTNNKLYLSIFDANPATHAGIQTYELKVNGIESFVVLSIPLVDENAIDQNYVLIKTTDGSYYTDYSFDGTTDIKITKVISVQGLETTESEVPETNLQEENANEVPQENVDEITEGNVEESTETENSTQTEANVITVDPYEPTE